MIALFLSPLALQALPATQEQMAPAAKAEVQSGDYAQIDTLRVRQRVEADGTRETTVRIGVLLRTSAAVAAFGQVGFPYVDGFGEVSFDDVVVKKADGRLVTPKDLKPEDINPFGVSGLPIAADIRVRKLTIPGLEPGDRLSYRAVMRQRPLTPGKVFGDSKFIPMVSDPLQVLELDLPRDASINVRLREGLGAAWEDVPSPPDRIVRRLALRVPQPPERPEGPSEAEARAWSEPDVMYTNFKSWEDVGQWWWALSKDRLVPDAAVKAEAQRMVLGRASPREKLEAIAAYVASRIRYLSVSFGLGRMQPRQAGEVLANRYGDCKDKHALIAALASAVGIEVRPVLVHTVRKDLLDDSPGPQQFDHMISVAPFGKDPAGWLWIDGTNPLALPGHLSPTLRDKRVLLIEADGKGRIVRTPRELPFTPRTDVEGKGALEASGLLRMHMRWTVHSDYEVGARFHYGTLPRERYAESVKGSFARAWKDAKVANVTISDPSDLSVPFRIEFDVEQTVPKRRSDQEWPLWIPLPDFNLPEPRKKLEGPEEKAVEFGSREMTVRAEIELPEGVTARAPLSVSVERPFGHFRSSYAVEGRTLRIERTLKLGRDSILSPEVAAYESFRKALDGDREQNFLAGALGSGAASAETLHAEGKAAFEAKEYDRAIELLRKATEADPKAKNGWEDLGQALRDKGDKAGAIKAFDKQIEIDPFDEYAYAHRAYVLSEQGRWDEAEKDLLKQIEVAPFKAWSYGKLGKRRMSQRRYREAAEYYNRAATLEPKEEAHWIDLAWACLDDGRKDEARSALERARSLSLEDWQQVSVARAFHIIGDDSAVGSLAEAAATSIGERLSKLSATTFDDGSRYWMSRLVEAWQLTGAAALAAGELGKAERYLEASWRVGLAPEAAWSLGLLRERQERGSESARWLAAAESLPGAGGRLPLGHRGKAEAARKTASSDSVVGFVMAARTIKLTDTPLADFTEEVLLLLDAGGAVESVKNESRKSPQAFDRQLAKLGTLKLTMPRPDDRPVKLVLRGLLSCYRPTTCSLILDLPGMQSIAEVP